MASHDVYVKADGSGVARFNVDFHPFLKEAGKVQSDYNTFTIGVRNLSNTYYISCLLSLLSKFIV